MATKRKPKDPTITQRDRAYRERQKAAGLVPVRVFVPAKDAQRIRTLAQELRAGTAEPIGGRKRTHDYTLED